MPYLYSTPTERQQMLAKLGIESVDELFSSIPDDLKLGRPLDVPQAMCEIELDRHLRSLANRNGHTGELVCFLGGGSYDHFVPAVVDAIASRSEFYTSYTPYQAEVSQGNLQVTFEYQSLIARLTGMDVSNASVYDGGSAAAEAVLMAMSCAKRSGKVILPASLHPEYRQIVATYLTNQETEIVTLPTSQGVIEPTALARLLDAETACVLLQQPNFFGCVEDATEVAKVVHQAGALLVAAVDPISLGLLRRPGEYEADIVVAEGHTLGTPMSYGGPYLGIMACRREFVRRMPGRIAGETIDRHGNRCFVLTLQTREQHIRREKATSNICTNQGLFALRAAAYLAQLGPQGLRETAELCLQKCHYAAQRLCQSDRFSLAFDRPTFKEFVVRDKEADVDAVLAGALAGGYLAGVPLGRWYPELDDCFLVAVTEKRTRQEIDGWVTALTAATSSPAGQTPSYAKLA